MANSLDLATIRVPLINNSNNSTENNSSIAGNTNQPSNFSSVFRSGYFETYLNQFKHLIQQESSSLTVRPDSQFGRLTHQFIQMVSNSTYRADEASMERLQQTVCQQLERLIQAKNNLPPAHRQTHEEYINIIDNVCEWIYTGFDFWEPMSHWMAQNTPPQVNDPDVDLPSYLNRCANSIESSGRFTDRGDNVVGLNHAFRNGNFASWLFSYPRRNGETKIIRTPAVTVDLSRDIRTNDVTSAEIAPEFNNFLMSYQQQGKKHLYINLMDRTLNSEKLRSNTIEHLMDNEGLRGAIQVVTLDKDSAFYHQAGAFANCSLAEPFKTAFMERMFESSPDSCFFWPAELNSDEWQDWCKEIINETHDTYFASRDHLTTQERKDFIELTYLRIIKELLANGDFDSCNISCKNCVDRGASELALLYTDTLMKQNSPLDFTQKQKIAALTFGPALMERSRLPQSYRTSRLTTALSALQRPTNYPSHIQQSVRSDISLLAQRALTSVTEKINRLIQRLGLIFSSAASYNAVMDRAIATYARSREYFAPVAIKWTEYLLDRANREGKKIVFMARDGAVPFQLAQAMLNDPVRSRQFPNLTPSSICLGYFSRKIIQDCQSNGPDGARKMQEYISQLGIQDGDNCLFVDVGFTGSMIDSIKSMLAPQHINIDFEFLISYTPKAHGFMAPTQKVIRGTQPPSNSTNSTTAVADRIIHAANPRAIHWLEDSHQGVIRSPQRLVRYQGRIYTDTNIPGYERTYSNQPIDHLLRLVGQSAVTTSLEELDPSTIDTQTAVAGLNRFLISIEEDTLPLHISHFDIVGTARRGSRQ